MIGSKFYPQRSTSGSFYIPPKTGINRLLTRQPTEKNLCVLIHHLRSLILVIHTTQASNRSCKNLKVENVLNDNEGDRLLLYFDFPYSFYFFSLLLPSFLQFYLLSESMHSLYVLNKQSRLPSSLHSLSLCSYHYLSLFC